MGPSPVSEEIINVLPNLKIIGNFLIFGYDNIDIQTKTTSKKN